MGQDRRLPTDLESGLFRIVDDALAAYLGLAPDHMSLKLDVDGPGSRSASPRADAAGHRRAAVAVAVAPTPDHPSKKADKARTRAARRRSRR